MLLAAFFLSFLLYVRLLFSNLYCFPVGRFLMTAVSVLNVTERTYVPFMGIDGQFGPSVMGRLEVKKKYKRWLRRLYLDPEQLDLYYFFGRHLTSHVRGFFNSGVATPGQTLPFGCIRILQE